MSTLLRSLQSPEPPQLNIPEAVTRKTRYPVIVLVDASQSTDYDAIQGVLGGPNADIHRINAALAKLVNLLRTPQPGPLLDNRDAIDVTIISYSNDMRVELPWTPAFDLPPMIAPIVPREMTNTGEAILYAIDYALKHYRNLKGRNISCGMPHIFHITDGCPTDMQPGSPLWKEVQDMLARMASSKNPEKRYMALKNIVTANGCDINSPGCLEMNGQRYTGLDVMKQLAAGSQTYELTNTEDAFHDLIGLFTVLITNVTQLADRERRGVPEQQFASDNIQTH